MRSKPEQQFIAASGAPYVAPSSAPSLAPLEEFFDQAAAAEYALRANQLMSFFVPPSRGHDDLLNAAALAVQAGPLSQLRVASGRRARQPESLIPAHPEPVEGPEPVEEPALSLPKGPAVGSCSHKFQVG